MTVSPLIQKLKSSGSSLYSFTSGLSHEQLASNNDDYQFVFSKFVALNIPSIKTPTNNKNNIQFLSVDGQIFNGTSPYNSINLIQSFQNYALNLESLIIGSDNYDNTILQTTSERVFFKWLKEIGAVRFRQAYDSEANEVRYTEEDNKTSGSTLYDKVVNYIGDIDIVNNVQHGGLNYTEIYLNIPSTVGSTPVVLFKSVEDVNYKPGMIFQGVDEFLSGRTIATIHPEGLSLHAFYDYDTSVDYLYSVNANVFNQDPITGSFNSYFTERSIFTDPTNTDIIKNSLDYPSADPFSNVSYRRSKLDGIQLEFDPAIYTEIANDPLVNTIQEYNSMAKSVDFDFNAILIYYDIYNQNTPDIRSTNLYGVLFLDNVVEDIDQSYIPTFKKYKFNSFTNKNGNSYGLKINFRNSQSIENNGVDTIINDSNTFSMGLFVDTMVQLQNCVINFQEQNRQIIDLNNRISNIEGILYTTDDINILKLRIDELTKTFNDSYTALKDTKVFINMIASLNDRFNALINNKLNVQMQYNTDVIQGGSGIDIDKSVLNKVIINNKIQEYNIDIVANINNVIINSDNLFDTNTQDLKLYVLIKEYSNYIKIYNSADRILNSYLSLYLNDKNVKFKNGQVIKIVFANNIDFGSYNLRIYSDFTNKFGYGSLNKIIANLSYTELSSKPMIELICIDKDNYIFDYNIIK